MSEDSILARIGRALAEGEAIDGLVRTQHLRYYLSLLRRLEAMGHDIASVDIAVSDTARDEGRLERARAEVLAPLGSEFPEATLRIDREREQGRSYYSGLCLRVDASTAGGLRANLADGGSTKWTQRLLSNAKERLLVSGLGIDLLVKLFRSDRAKGAPSPGA